MSLVGVVNSGGIHDHVIVQIGVREHVLYRLDLVEGDWWLDTIGKDHILLTDGEHFARVDLYYGHPYLVSKGALEESDSDQVPRPEAEPAVPLPGPMITTPGTLHTAATHSDLAPGQQRRFHAPPQEPLEELADDSPMAQWLSAQEDINDPGASRRFSTESIAENREAEFTEESVNVAQLGTDSVEELEPGQYRRFGPPPPPDEESLEE